MKKRKGKQSQPEAVASTEADDSTETTVVDAPVPGTDAGSPDPDAEAVPEASMTTGDAGDDDITSRWEADTSEPVPAPEDTAIEAAVEVSAEDASESAPGDDAPADAPGESTDDGASRGDGDAIEAAASDGADAEATEGGEGDAAGEGLPIESSRLESILESILFASDRPLGLTDLKRLLGERDGKRLGAALESLREKRAEAGIQLVPVAGGWQLRTHPVNGAWVAKLVAGRPPRLSRAMMETLAIVAYRQPITRPEIDEIRGVDCGPVLHTLLDRGLVRVIGKKEEVGRPMLYGTTPEFLKIFSLKDLSELPTLREFHELAAEDRARVDATVTEGAGATVVAVTEGAAGAPPLTPVTGELSDPDPAEEDALLDALDEAASAAARATASADKPEGAPESEDAAASAAPARTGRASAGADE